jgi:hypothetical protein
VEQNQNSGQSPWLSKRRRLSGAQRRLGRRRIRQTRQMSTYLLIRHELSKGTKAKRGEVAEAKARNRQRDACACLRKDSLGQTFHTTVTISNTSEREG